MSSSWRDRITDPIERKVFEALADPQWDFRTLPGLSKATGIAESTVKDIVERYPEFSRRSPVPDSEGRALYTLISKGSSLREWYRTTRAFITKST
jgi:hypothetical protein